jgi:hypothetical protein
MVGEGGNANLVENRFASCSDRLEVFLFHLLGELLQRERASRQQAVGLDDLAVKVLQKPSKKCQTFPTRNVKLSRQTGGTIYGTMSRFAKSRSE